MSVSYDMCKNGNEIDTYRGKACFSNNTGDKIVKDRVYKVYIRRNSLRYCEDEIEQYLKLVNNAGFSCEGVGFKMVQDYEGYFGGGDPCGEFEAYQVNVYDKNQLNKTHRLATLTAVRYLWEGSYKTIPRVALDLRMSTDWCPFQILTLSNFFASRAKNMLGTGHCLIKFGDETLQIKEEYFENLKQNNFNKKRKDTYIHKSFRNNGRQGFDNDTRKEIVEIYNSGQFEKAKEYFL